MPCYRAAKEPILAGYIIYIYYIYIYIIYILYIYYTYYILYILYIYILYIHIYIYIIYYILYILLYIYCIIYIYIYIILYIYIICYGFSQKRNYSQSCHGIYRRHSDFFCSTSSPHGGLDLWTSHACLPRARVEEFHQHINSINSQIQFTIEIEDEDQLSFLNMHCKPPEKMGVCK